MFRVRSGIRSGLLLPAITCRLEFRRANTTARVRRVEKTPAHVVALNHITLCQIFNALYDICRYTVNYMVSHFFIYLLS